MNIPSLSGVTKAVIALSAGGVLAGAIALGANGGGGGGAASPPAQVVAPTATSVPESGGDRVRDRTDCPQDWTLYVDPDGYFSFCYPENFQAGVADGVAGGSKAITVMTPQDAGAKVAKANSVVFTIYWKPESSFVRGLIQDRCQTARTVFKEPVREETRSIDGNQTAACVGTGPGRDASVQPLAIEMPDPVASGFIQVFAFQSGPDLTVSGELIHEILSSIRLRK
jgi:hypothetical protein